MTDRAVALVSVVSLGQRLNAVTDHLRELVAVVPAPPIVPPSVRARHRGR